MKYNPGERVFFKPLERTFKCTIVRSLKDGFYLVDDGTNAPPRPIHGSKLSKVEVPHDKTQVFA